jgi:hypothetical protein
MDPSSRFGADSSDKSELKIREFVVGAWRFELQTSCAQGRRATRLRYAPTCECIFDSNLHFLFELCVSGGMIAAIPVSMRLCE